MQTWLVAMGLLALAACRPLASAPPVPPPLPSDEALHVLLAWAAPVDLDLYVTDPAGESLYFGNNPTRARARLEADARCPDVTGGAPTGIEHALLEAPAPGQYRIGVDFLDDCRSGLAAVPFRVVVEMAGDRRSVVGTAQRGIFAVVVLELVVGEDGRLAGGR